MPPKVRELIKLLMDAGFVEIGWKGSHRNFRHPSGMKMTLSGASGTDAKPYQVLNVRKLLARVSK